MLLTDDHQYDIIGLAETNITKTEGLFINKQIKDHGVIYWNNNSQHKIKGSGTAIFVRNTWTQRVGKVDRINDNILVIHIYCKQAIIMIMQIYMPPNDPTQCNANIRAIQEFADKNHSPNTTHSIIMGDFNAVADVHKDRLGSKTNNKSLARVFDILRRKGYIDAFRYVNPDATEYTWRSHNHASRIDYIWISQYLDQSIISCNIDDASTITHSDHQIVNCTISSLDLIRNYARSQEKRNGNKRLIFDYEKATAQQWTKYNEDTQDKFMNNIELQSLLDSEDITQETIDRIWNLIKDTLSFCANKNIPKKRSQNKQNISRKKLDRLIPSDTFMQLRRLQAMNKACNLQMGLPIDNATLKKYDIHIAYLKTKHEGNELINSFDVPNPPLYTERWKEEIKRIYKEVKTICDTKLKKAEIKSIEQKIAQRADWITSNQRKMLNSLLNKYKDKIVVDRLIIEQDDQKLSLITDPDEICRLAPSQFKDLQKKRMHKFDNLPEEWKAIYKPIESIREEYYDHILVEPTEQEWLDTLKSCNDKSAPGTSNIGYKLIKKASEQAQTIFRKFASLIFKTALFPQEWLQTCIFPIPKPTDWQYKLNATRPILLIECLRKLYIKLITNRISKIMIKHNILKGPNFAGLPGGSTHHPIHTINNIIEDAHDNSKEVWIILQDMAKAFDSVGLTPLEHALNRIKFPPTLTTLIINLFKDRRMRIITKYGLSDSFVAGDGIDQGEVISPLIWRIFYDPLLTKIQDDETLGYEMHINWPSNETLDPPNNEEIYLRMACTAFADDTAWIAKNKEESMYIISISNEFYDINDIKINGKKSELIVVNPSVPKNDQLIRMGSDNAIVTANDANAPSRYLGIYIRGKKGQSHIVKKVEEEIKECTDILKYKKLTVAQLVYVNNRVIIPRAEYRMQSTSISDNTATRLHRPFIMLLKKKLSLSSKTHNNLIHHTGLIGALSLQQSLFTAQSTNLVIRLNENTLSGRSTRMRLRHAQLKLGLSKCILTCEPSDIVYQKLNNNFAFNTLRKMKDQLFSFTMPERITNTWNVKENCTPIIDILNSLNDSSQIHIGFAESKAIRSYHNRGTKHLPLLNVSQLLTNNGMNMLSWNQYKLMNDITLKGATPIFFKSLENKLLIPNDSHRTTIFAHSSMQPEISTPTIRRIRPSSDKRKREWILDTNDPHNYGKITKKHSLTSISYEHWAPDPLNQSVISRCTGCHSVNMPSMQSNKEPACVKSGKINDFSIIKVVPHPVGINQEIRKRIITPIDSLCRDYNRAEINRHQANETQMMSEIMIIDYDEAIIDKWTPTSELQWHFKFCLKAIKEHSKNLPIEIYTDGSLAFNERDLGGTTIMGAGWILKDTEISFHCGITKFPSSTRAEIVAILTAILATPSNNKLYIYTDSQAAIDGINNTLTLHQQSTAHSLKQHNYILLHIIKDLLINKNITLQLEKVKGHSQNRWNDVADTLAKHGRTEAIYNRDRNFTLETLDRQIDLNSIGCVLTWDGHYVDRNIRSYISLVSNLTIEAQWSYNNQWQPIFDHDHASNFNYQWSSFWNSFAILNHHNCRSFKTSADFIFKLKRTNNLLPTIDKLRLRSPYYNQLKCVFCNIQDETLKHLATCPSLELNWNRIEDEISRKLTKTANKRLTHANKCITESTIKTSVFEYINPSDQILKPRNRMELLQDIISDTIVKRLCRLTSVTIGHYLTEKLIHLFNSAFKEHVWKPRCQKIQEAEQRIGITKDMKYNKTITTTNNSATTSNQPSITSQLSGSCQHINRSHIALGYYRLRDALTKYVIGGNKADWGFAFKKSK